MKIRAIAGNVIREARRQKVIYVTVIFALLLLSVAPLLPSFKVGLRVQLFNDIALGIAYLSIAAVAVGISVNQIPAEIEQRTVYSVLSKPVRRTEFVIGKFIGVISVLLICVVLMGLAIMAFTYSYFGSVSYNILAGLTAVFLQGMLIAAFALLVSTFTSPTVNIFACFLFYFVGHIKNDILKAVLPSSQTTHSIGLIIKYALPSLGNFNLNEAIARGAYVEPYLMLQLTLYALIFSMFFLGAASLIFAQREI